MDAWGTQYDLDRPMREYLNALLKGDHVTGLDVVLRQLDMGVPVETIITNVLGRAQHEIGEGWAQAQWGISKEHRASAITETVLRALVTQSRSLAGAIPAGSRGSTLVVCAEGEWHVLPALMLAEVLRTRGLEVTLLAPSLPATGLEEMVTACSTPIVAVTCSMPQSLGGAWRTISTLRQLGVLVACGGRGFGADDTWGTALGVDFWAADLSAGADIICSVADRPGPREDVVPVERQQETTYLRSMHSTLVEAALLRAAEHGSPFGAGDRSILPPRELVSDLLRAIEAATVVGSALLVTDHVDWAESVLDARGLPLSDVPAACSLVLDVLPDSLPHARGMADAAYAARRG